MKKIAKVFAIIASITTIGMMTSCTKNNFDLIIGKWKEVSISQNGETLQVPESIAPTWEFTEEEKLIITNIDEDGSPRTRTTVYHLEKDNLMLDGYTFTIKELDKNKLTLYLETDGKSDFTYTYCFIRI